MGLFNARVSIARVFCCAGNWGGGLFSKAFALERTGGCRGEGLGRSGEGGTALGMAGGVRLQEWRSFLIEFGESQYCDTSDAAARSRAPFRSRIHSAPTRGAVVRSDPRGSLSPPGAPRRAPAGVHRLQPLEKLTPLKKKI